MKGSDVDAEPGADGLRNTVNRSAIAFVKLDVRCLGLEMFDVISLHLTFY